MTAEIADLETREEMLHIAGKASGTDGGVPQVHRSQPGRASASTTSRRDARLSASGELDLKLVMPLRQLDKTRVEGRYRFSGNSLKADPGLPPLTEVNGELRFTADRLEATKVRAVSVRRAADGGCRRRAAMAW